MADTHPFKNLNINKNPCLNKINSSKSKPSRKINKKNLRSFSKIILQTQIQRKLNLQDQTKKPSIGYFGIKMISAKSKSVKKNLKWVKSCINFKKIIQPNGFNKILQLKCVNKKKKQSNFIKKFYNKRKCTSISLKDKN
jgi:hypothetical protein